LPREAAPTKVVQAAPPHLLVWALLALAVPQITQATQPPKRQCPLLYRQPIWAVVAQGTRWHQYLVQAGARARWVPAAVVLVDHKAAAVAAVAAAAAAAAARAAAVHVAAAARDAVWAAHAAAAHAAAAVAAVAAPVGHAAAAVDAVAGAWADHAAVAPAEVAWATVEPMCRKASPNKVG